LTALRLPSDFWPSAPLPVVAVRPERRGAAGTDPLVAALVPPFCSASAGAASPSAFPSRERLDELLFFLGQMAFAELYQPFLGQFGLGVARGSIPLNTWPKTRRRVEVARSSPIARRQEIEFLIRQRDPLPRARPCIRYLARSGWHPRNPIKADSLALHGALLKNELTSAVLSALPFLHRGVRTLGSKFARPAR